MNGTEIRDAAYKFKHKVEALQGEAAELVRNCHESGEFSDELIAANLKLIEALEHLDIASQL